MKLKQKDFIKIAQKSNGRCFYCNSIEASDVDHFVSKYWWNKWDLDNAPWDKRLDDIENLFLACKDCNSKKRNKHPEDFIGVFKSWDRYYRANYRVGLSDIKKYTL